MQRLSILLLSLPLLATACGPTDTDGDLLLDEFELAIGTNPELADSDGDGFTDSTEYLQYFDPTDEEDFPYSGGYPRLPLPDDIDDEGFDEGEVSRDWDSEDAEDQHGEIVNIHKFFGSVVVVDIGSEWCQPCRDAGPEVEAEYQDFKDRGFVVLNLLLDGLTQQSAPEPDRWIEDLELTFPVIADQDQSMASNYIDSSNGSFSIPNFSLLGRDLEIHAKYVTSSLDWSMVEDLLDEDPPTVDWPLPANAEEIREQLGYTKLDIDYIVPGEGIPEAAGSANIGSSTGSGAATGSDSSTSNGDSGNSAVNEVAPGQYAGPPFGGGGAGCSVLTGKPKPSITWTLLAVLGLLFPRRRR
ncbi:MAG: hypothetical protein CMP23_03225 [Rickettsiales bacterium]|nr:hypothetical protein [Rickettsiales bacterium]